MIEESKKDESEKCMFLQNIINNFNAKLKEYLAKHQILADLGMKDGSIIEKYLTLKYRIDDSSFDLKYPYIMLRLPLTELKNIYTICLFGRESSSRFDELFNPYEIYKEFLAYDAFNKQSKRLLLPKILTDGFAENRQFNIGKLQLDFAVENFSTCGHFNYLEGKLKKFKRGNRSDKMLIDFELEQFKQEIADTERKTKEIKQTLNQIEFHLKHEKNKMENKEPNTNDDEVLNRKIKIEEKEKTAKLFIPDITNNGHIVDNIVQQIYIKSAAATNDVKIKKKNDPKKKGDKTELSLIQYLCNPINFYFYLLHVKGQIKKISDYFENNSMFSSRMREGLSKKMESGINSIINEFFKKQIFDALKDKLQIDVKEPIKDILETHKNDLETYETTTINFVLVNDASVKFQVKFPNILFNIKKIDELLKVYSFIFKDKLDTTGDLKNNLIKFIKDKDNRDYLAIPDYLREAFLKEIKNNQHFYN